MIPQPRWEVEGRDWPHRASSRFVAAAGLTWHVQIKGQGPVMLLLHGTGAATHSWRGLTQRLSDSFTIVAPDLPGHGFTSRDPRQALSLPHMAAQLAGLLLALDLRPERVVGHSAGAAIALQMVLDGAIQPRLVISLNGALLPFDGVEAVLYPILAKLLFLNPLATALVGWRASDPTAVAKVIAGTGSPLDREGIDYYVRLLATKRHVAATLGMMAQWDLRRFQRDLGQIDRPVLLVASEGDAAVPPQVARDCLTRLPRGDLRLVAGLGHLAHEEAPETIAEIILKACM